MDEITIDDFSWLLGAWRLQGASETFETWQRADQAAFSGRGYTLRAGQVQVRELLRLEQRKDEILYWADVPHNPAPVAFSLVSYDALTARYENPAHDFPQRIEYQRRGEHALQVVISGPDQRGGERSVVFNFARAPIALRPVQAADLSLFFDQQLDPDANFMAAFVHKNPADRQAFDAHWAKILSDPGITLRAIVWGGQLAGYVVCHAWFGAPEISYWLGREFWGQGIASQALAAFLGELPVRPLYARAVKDNLASLRVLEKCGFKITGEARGFAEGRGAVVEEFLLQLD